MQGTKAIGLHKSSSDFLWLKNKKLVEAKTLERKKGKYAPLRILQTLSASPCPRHQEHSVLKELVIQVSMEPNFPPGYSDLKFQGFFFFTAIDPIDPNAQLCFNQILNRCGFGIFDRSFL